MDDTSHTKGNWEMNNNDPDPINFNKILGLTHFGEQLEKLNPYKNELMLRIEGKPFIVISYVKGGYEPTRYEVIANNKLIANSPLLLKASMIVQSALERSNYEGDDELKMAFDSLNEIINKINK